MNEAPEAEGAGPRQEGAETSKVSPPLSALNLSDLDKSKNSLVMILKDFYAGRIRDKKFRTLCFGFQTLIGYLRLQAEIEWQRRDREVLDRLLAIETALGGPHAR